MPYAAERMLHRAWYRQINAEHCMESAVGCMVNGDGQRPWSDI